MIVKGMEDTIAPPQGCRAPTRRRTLKAALSAPAPMLQSEIAHRPTHPKDPPERPTGNQPQGSQRAPTGPGDRHGTKDHARAREVSGQPSFAGASTKGTSP